MHPSSAETPPDPLCRSEYRGPVEWKTFGFGAISIRLARPAEPDRLLDDPRVIAWNRRDDYMPYWAYLWPSAVLLAEWVAGATLPERSDGAPAPTTLEIGCGLGLPGLVAVARGLRVRFSDGDPSPLEFVARSAAENRFDPGLYSIGQLDWRDPPDERFSMILGADVLYELRLVPLVAGLLSRLLTAHGMGAIASPFRAAAERFPAALAEVGLVCQAVTATTRSAEGKSMEGMIYRVTRPDSSVTSERIPPTSYPV